MRIEKFLIILTVSIFSTATALAQIPGQELSGGQPGSQNPLEGLARPSQAPFEGTYEEGFENITALMEKYDAKGNVSLMKLGRMAMTMGRTVGKAGSAWTRKVAKAFKKVDVVYMLDYGESRPEIKDEIEEGVLRYLKKEYLVKRDGEGNFAFDETYGVKSEDGKHVSNLVIILYGQSVVALEGSVLTSDVDRIIRRLNKQL